MGSQKRERLSVLFVGSQKREQLFVACKAPEPTLGTAPIQPPWATSRGAGRGGGHPRRSPGVPACPHHATPSAIQHPLTHDQTEDLGPKSREAGRDKTPPPPRGNLPELPGQGAGMQGSEFGAFQH